MSRPAEGASVATITAGASSSSVLPWSSTCTSNGALGFAFRLATLLTRTPQRIESAISLVRAQTRAATPLWNEHRLARGFPPDDRDLIAPRSTLPYRLPLGSPVGKAVWEGAPRGDQVA